MSLKDTFANAAAQQAGSSAVQGATSVIFPGKTSKKAFKYWKKAQPIIEQNYRDRAQWLREFNAPEHLAKQELGMYEQLWKKLGLNPWEVYTDSGPAVQPHVQQSGQATSSEQAGSGLLGTLIQAAATLAGSHISARATAGAAGIGLAGTMGAAGVGAEASYRCGPSQCHFRQSWCWSRRSSHSYAGCRR